jgi:eukaryotic-like serine/threonine-protein kinase
MSSGSIVPGGQRASDAPREPSQLGVRSALGKYQVVRELGAGGMGTVYLAVDSNLKRTVALKILHKDRATNETLVRRFESEAHAAAQLKHENIVTVYDAGQIEGNLFIALEFVDGTDIHELVAKRGAVPLKRSLGFIKQVVRALDHLHKRGIVHRDIKPSNLLLTKDGTVKLTDLGLARAVDESTESGITREGTTVGTVDYMAPEQARNSQAADIRSDIYSLGCTWYQMLTGEPPFPEGSVTNKLYSHISKPRPDPRSFNQTVPDEIVAVMHKMMARKVDDRYQTPAELLNDLDNLGSGYKRLEEVLGEDNSPNAPPYAQATPAHGSPLPLPPRHSLRPAPKETDSGDRAASDRSGPEHRLPARQLPAPDRRAPPPRQTPASGRPILPPDQPVSAPGRQTPTPARQMPVPARTITGERPGLRGEPLASKVGAGNQRASTRRGGVVSDEPVGTFRDPNRPLEAGASFSAADWQPIAVKIGVALAAVAAVGLLAWFTEPYWNPDKSHGLTVTRNPFDPSASNTGSEAAAADDEPTKKGDKPATTDKGAADSKQKSQGTKSRNPVVLAETKKPANNGSIGATSIPARPAERAEFPSWIDELWDPRGTAAPQRAALTTIKVGRAGKDPAQTSTLAEALARLPADGGVIELRGPGPFLLPSQRIDKRRQVIFTGNPASAKSGGAMNAPRPLIVILPPPRSAGPKAASGLFASETSLTFYGVDLVAFADEFRGEKPLRLVEVSAGDLAVQKCSLTMVGTRTAPTTAFIVSSAPADRPPRLLLDRTVVRGGDLAAIEADLQAVDFLAINSLFVTGHAPMFTLAADATAQGSATAIPAGGLARMMRFFSCTACSDESAIMLRADSDSSDPPTTRFRVLNSLFGVATQTQSPMVALTNWPVLSASAGHAARFKNLSWKSQSFVARGWQDNLVGGAAGARLAVREAQDWGQFWGDIRSSVDYQSTPFPTIGDFATALPAQFKAEKSLLHDTAGDTALPGCDTGLLAVSGADMIRRADAFSRRPVVASDFEDGETPKHPVREIDLDNPGHPSKADLSKIINEADWPSGTRFLVHGTKKKLCGPIRVVNRSLCLEFVDKGLVLGFDDRKIESAGDRSAFITVTGGSIEIVNANMRIESSTRASTPRLLDVRGGNFAIRNCSLAGPRREYPAYEELIRFSSSQDGSLAAGEGEVFSGSVRNSFLLGPKDLFRGDLSARNLVCENSLLVAGNRLFDLRLPVGPGPSSLDLRSCTLSAGGEYFHFSTKSADSASNRGGVFVENSLFAPPVRQTESGGSHAALIGPVSSEFFRERVDWWEYANAYSDLIQLPGSAGPAQGTKSEGADEPLESWRQIAGPAHIVRSIGGLGAVLLPGDVSTVKEVDVADFRLKPEAQAATWSDAGKAVGADLSMLNVPPTRPTKRTPAPKSVTPKKPVAPAAPNSGI